MKMEAICSGGGAEGQVPGLLMLWLSHGTGCELFTLNFISVSYKASSAFRRYLNSVSFNTHNALFLHLIPTVNEQKYMLYTSLWELCFFL